MEYIKMKLGEPDASGRRKPIPIDGSEATVDVDFVAVAIGRTPNPIVQSVAKGIEVKNGGIIVTENETAQTSREGVSQAAT
jgi:glutamate synthase (NADPH) small chain